MNKEKWLCFVRKEAPRKKRFTVCSGSCLTGCERYVNYFAIRCTVDGTTRVGTIGEGWGLEAMRGEGGGDSAGEPI